MAFPVSPTAYWKLEDANDALGLYNFTNTSTTFSAGKVNNCAVFNGSASLIASNSIIPNGAKSISFWFKTSSSTGNPVIFGNAKAYNESDGIFAFIDGTDSGRLKVMVRKNGSNVIAQASTSSSVTDNSWRHVVLTWDGTTSSNSYKLYINNSLEQQATPTSTETSSPAYNLHLGRNPENTSSNLTGSIDEFGVWSRVLTTNEIAALYNSGNGASDYLTLASVSYWKLDESSGNAADSVGSNTLTNNNTVTYGSGKINNGVDLESGSSQYLSAADSASLDITGNLSFSAWIKIESNTGSNQVVAGKWTDSGNQRSWMLYINSGLDTINFVSSDTGADPTVGNQSVSWSPSTGVWYHVAAVYTASAGSVSFYVNGVQRGATQTGARTSLFNSSADFRLGTRFSSVAIEFFDGMIDEVGIWSRALTADEVSQLYNSNRALAYPLTTPTLYGGVAYYKLDESSGGASDSINSYTLSNVNTVTYTTGKINNAADFGATNSNRLLGVNNTLGIDGGNASISAWFNVSTLPGSGEYQQICKQSNDASSTSYELRLYNNSGTYQLLFLRGKNSVAEDIVTYSFTPSTGTWYHAVITYDGTTVTGYLGGVSRGTVSSSGSGTGPEPDYFTIGGRYNSALTYFYPFKGLVDEVVVFNRALTSTEVTELYNSGSGKQYPWTTLIYTLVCDAGSFALTGVSAALRQGFNLICSAGSFILTGVDVLLRKVGWINQDKNTSTWTNGTKNTSSWTNGTKNTPTWTNQSKN